MRDRKRAGQTAVLFTLAMLPLCGAVGLVVDLGWAYFRKEAEQAAADAAAGAAALAAFESAAGASTSCSTPGVSCSTSEYVCPATLTSPPANNLVAGCMYARDNGFVTGGRRKVTMQAGVGYAPTASGVTTSYWVVARVSEQIPQLFSAVLGKPTMNITARATTGVKDASSGGCIITLDQIAEGSLTMVGNTVLQSGCGVFVNSNSPNAISIVGGAAINTTLPARTEIVGDTANPENIHPAPLVGRPYMGDPFAELEPPTGSCNATVPVLGSQDSATINPGVYCSGIILTSHQSLTLTPGVYIVRGGIDLGAQTSISGSGVTLYLQTGGINMAGGAAVSLTAPSSGDWQGILFFQARDNDSESTLVGGTSAALNGALYFPAAHLNYTGGAAATATTIIARTLTMVGNSNISAPATTHFTGGIGGVAIIE